MYLEVAGLPYALVALLLEQPFHDGEVGLHRKSSMSAAHRVNQTSCDPTVSGALTSRANPTRFFKALSHDAIASQWERQRRSRTGASFVLRQRSLCQLNPPGATLGEASRF